MKRMIALMLACCVAFGASACGNGTNNTNEVNTQTNAEQSEQKEEKKEEIDISKMSDEQIINKFIEAGFPISKVIVYTEETDVNELLGRPKGYIQKTNFADSRYEQYNIDEDPVGGTIEIFNNSEDAKARYEYLDSVYDVISGRAYMYLRNNILFRIHSELTPTHAKEYEAGLDALINGELPTFTPSEPVKEVEETLSDNITVNGTCTVTIKDYVLSKDNDGNDVIIINYDFSNSGTEGKSFTFSTSTKVFQDGIELSDVFLYNNEYYNSENSLKEVKDGATISTQEAYKLSNLTSPVEIEITDFSDFSSKPKKLKKTFELQ